MNRISLLKYKLATRDFIRDLQHIKNLLDTKVSPYAKLFLCLWFVATDLKSFLPQKLCKFRIFGELMLTVKVHLSKRS